MEKRAGKAVGKSLVLKTESYAVYFLHDSEGRYTGVQEVHDLVSVSNCCGAKLLHASDICSNCYEHCESLTEEEWYE